MRAAHLSENVAASWLVREGGEKNKLITVGLGSRQAKRHVCHSFTSIYLSGGKSASRVVQENRQGQQLAQTERCFLDDEHLGRVGFQLFPAALIRFWEDGKGGRGEKPQPPERCISVRNRAKKQERREPQLERCPETRQPGDWSLHLGRSFSLPQPHSQAQGPFHHANQTASVQQRKESPMLKSSLAVAGGGERVLKSDRCAHALIPSRQAPRAHLREQKLCWGQRMSPRVCLRGSWGRSRSHGSLLATTFPCTEHLCVRVQGQGMCLFVHSLSHSLNKRV